ncbi:DUF2510 domain-containing protein [Aquihabitans sp. G128]|uniref:DUF2510 domain-containing protein n=1 Tax=Aquihabitans sp. G128 TaxID=2849779 RepID=UPI00352E25E1
MSAAGWYADPTGRFSDRWHDGADWTDQVLGANGQPTADPLARTSSGYAAPDGPSSDAPAPPPASRPPRPAASAPPWPVGGRRLRPLRGRGGRPGPVAWRARRLRATGPAPRASGSPCRSSGCCRCC